MLQNSDLSIYYKGIDEKIHRLYLNGGTYYHEQISNSSGPNVHTTPGALTLGNSNEIFYIGNDDKVHRYYHNGSAWIYDDMSAYYNGQWYPDDHKARANIVYEHNTRKVLYFGYDGRLQYFGWDPFNNYWFHDHLDKYYNTHEYKTFTVDDALANSPSLTIHPNGDIYYTGNCIYYDHDNIQVNREQHLRCFKYQPCEKLNPPSQSWQNLNREGPGGEKTNLADEVPTFFPNPSNTGIYNLKASTQEGRVEVFNIHGQRILQKIVTELNGVLDLSNQPNGMYILKFVFGENINTQKLIINK